MKACLIHNKRKDGLVSGGRRRKMMGEGKRKQAG
jgi:hypothetical protein